MKTLEEFELVKAFLESQGSKPNPVTIVALDDIAWKDVKFLAREWRDARNEEIAKAEEALANLSEEELALRDKEAREQVLLEQDRVTYHSCGSRPEKSNV